MLNQGLARYIEPDARERLAQARVGIAGAGGLGSNCAMLLARSGIKRFTIVDFDIVEPSNLNRQFYFPADIGRPKVAALGEHLLRLCPDLELTLLCERLTAENVTEIFSGADVVVEALDNAESKAILCNALLGGETFLVSASGLAGVSGPPMTRRRIGPNMVCVGDFENGVSAGRPPLAPRVMQAAALEAEAVLEFILHDNF